MATMVEVLANGRNVAPTSPVMTLKEAAVFLHVGVGWVRQRVYAGDLPYQILGGRYTILRTEVEAFLKRGWRRNGTSKTSQSWKN